MLFVIELDSETPIHRIDSTLRASHQSILKAFDTPSYSTIEKYLGDDDILGYRRISKLDYSQKNTFDFIGRYKLDKFEYRVTIESKVPARRL